MPCRSQKQKWELAAAAIEHLQLCLLRVHREDTQQPATSAAATLRPPGLAVMLDMLGVIRLSIGTPDLPEKGSTRI